MCVVCQKALCRDCVGRDHPRLLCRTCVELSTIDGFEYRSSVSIAGLPLIHICTGLDPGTMRPKVAKGVIAIGNIAIGAVAIAGLSCGIVTVGGGSIGLLFALGGAAIGAGLSIGGLAIGSFAVGGLAIGLYYAVGGVAFAPAVIDGRRCDQAVVEFIRQFAGSHAFPPSCR
jgi:hypothetical protein